MRIAFFTNNYTPFVGGVPVAIELLATSLRRLGHRVFIFAPDYDEPAPEDPDVFRTLSIKHFNHTGFSLPLPLALEVQMQFAELEVEVVHVHHPFILGQTGMHLARANDLPVVFTYHTQYERYTHYLPFGERMVADLAISLSTRFANCCDAIIAPSTDMRNTLLERGVDAPIHVIPTGVDIKRFRGGNPGWLRARYGLPAGDPLIVFVSRLAKEKNVGFILDAFVAVAAARPRARLVMVGSGDEEEALRRQAAQADLGARVTFAGTLTGEDLVSAYRAAEVFVFASTSETQGLVVLEAMAGGAPVVAVDAPGVRDVVRDGENGYLVPEGDANGFAARVLEILGDDGLRARMSAAARATAEGMSIENTAERVQQIYKHVIRRPRHGAKERFMLLQELLDYQFKRLAEGIDELMP
jgi:glycosyltransferase involved in cell wall biosynthesis